MTAWEFRSIPRRHFIISEQDRRTNKLPLSIRSLRAILHHQFGNTFDQSTLASMILSAKSSGRVNMTSWLPSISISLNSPRRDDIRG
jgi:hypothetical protein